MLRSIKSGCQLLLNLLMWFLMRAHTILQEIVPCVCSWSIVRKETLKQVFSLCAQKMIKRRLFSKPYSSYSSTMLGIDEGIVWKTVINILNGLKILHSNGIAHRDLKSENIFYHQGEAKIGDLNVSSISSSNAYYKTKTGTPYYTAPEIWKGDIYTSNCDIWSLGCIAYEMCALEPPFKAHSFPELYIKILRGEYEPLDEMYSNQLRTLIRLCLCVQPKERLSAQQLLQSKLVRQKIVFLGCPYESSGEIKLVREIKCPKALKLLNNHLPTAPEPTSSCSSIEQAKSKKTVQFQIKHSPIKYKNGSTKQCVRSEKHINLNDTEEVSKLQQRSGVHLRSMKKLPPIERQPLFKVQHKKGKQIRFRSQKKISEKENPA